MSNNDNFQLYSQENKKESKKKKTRNKKNDIQKEDEIKVELIIKNNNKTESTQDKTKNNDLILPKIENNNTLKKTHENDINYYSKTKEIENNKNPKEKDNQNLIISNENKININNDNKNKKDINSEEKEKNFEIKEKKLIEIFNKNKKNLMQVCSEIEENLNKIYNSQGKDDDNILNKTQNITNSSNNNSKLSKEQKEIIKKINNYKKKIKLLQNEIDIHLKLNNIEELENTLKERKKHLENIKKENLVLKNLKNQQSKDEKEVNDILAKKEQLNSVNEKILKMKDEAKIKKDYNHTLTEKLKNQNEQINNLQNRCKLINQNIAYYKVKQTQELQNHNEYNINNADNIDLNGLKQTYEEKISTLQKKQENIILKINEQNVKISELYNYNEVISGKIEEIIIQINENMKEIMTFENELKKKEILLYNSLKNKKRNSLSDRKPFHIGPINPVNINPKTKKSFDYQKYLKESEKNKNRIKLYSSADINAQPKTLREIEKLRTDIQQAIKKNELDDKIDKIIGKLKINRKNLSKNDKNVINEEDDVLNNLFKKNEEINGKNRYNFYVTEGANLPVSLKQESINKNLNSN